MTSILVVEGDVNDSYVLERKLTNGGKDKACFVDVRKSGKKALEAVREANFDAAIIDLDLPDMGGLDLIRYLTERRPGMVVIAVSGSDRGREGQCMSDKAVAAGAHGFVEKPFTSSDNDAVFNMIRAHKATYGRGFSDGLRQRAWRTTMGGSLSLMGGLMLAAAIFAAKPLAEQPILEIVAVLAIVAQGIGAFITGLYAAEKK